MRTQQSVTLNGNTYRLVRKSRKTAYSYRQWSRQYKRMPSTRIERPNIIRDQDTGDYVAVYNDWSRGVVGLNTVFPGAVHQVSDLDTTHPGMIRAVGQPEWYLVDTNDTSADAIIPLLFNDCMYIAWGRFVFKYSDGYLDSIKDWNDVVTGAVCTDAVVWNNQLIFALGRVAKISKMTANETFSTASDSVYADYLAIVGTRLWQSWHDDTQNNQVSNCASGDDPLELDNWSASIPVGDKDIKVTGLHALGERLAVCKENGLFLGDESAQFPNVLAEFVARDANNGKRAFVRGGDLFYPHKNGLVRYNRGRPVEEVGIQKTFDSVGNNINAAGWRVTAMTSQGEDLWAATYPTHGTSAWAKPTYVGITVDSEGTIVDYTDEATDGDGDTIIDAGGLNADVYGYLLVCHPEKATAWYFEIGEENWLAATSAVYVWNGSAWALPQSSDGSPNPLIDETAVSGVCINRSGRMTLRDKPSNWSESTIKGVEGYWARFCFTPTADATVATVSTCESTSGWSSDNGGYPQLDSEWKTQGSNSLYSTGDGDLYFAHSTLGVTTDLLARYWITFDHDTSSKTGDAGKDVHVGFGNDSSNLWWGIFQASADPQKVTFMLDYMTEEGSPSLTATHNRLEIYEENEVSYGQAIDNITIERGLSASAAIKEIRVASETPWVAAYRGRPAQAGDASASSITWTPVYAVAGSEDEADHGFTRALAIQEYNNKMYFFSRQRMTGYLIAAGGVDHPPLLTRGAFYTYKDDFGIPNIDKRFISMTIKGWNISATDYVAAFFCADNSTEWDYVTEEESTSTFIASHQSADISAIGAVKVVQWSFTAGGLAEIHCIEIRFREMPTYKSLYKLALEVGESIDENGMPLPEPDVQLTNLAATLGAGPVTLIDPLGNSVNVTVEDLDLVEMIQDEYEHSVTIAQITLVEV